MPDAEEFPGVLLPTANDHMQAVLRKRHDYTSAIGKKSQLLLANLEDVHKAVVGELVDVSRHPEFLRGTEGTGAELTRPKD